MDTRIRTLAACQTLAGAVALVTVTAPGVADLPWDATGKQVREAPARAWNASAPARWSALHHDGAKVARRIARELNCDWRLLVKTWEYQRRGVLHLHLLLPAGSPAELQASEAYTREIATRAQSHGFGFVDRGKLTRGAGRQTARRLDPVAPHRAAAYVASYMASTGAGKAGIAEVARRAGVSGAVVYVSARLTRRSGVTMRTLRARRRVACRYPGAVADAETWHTACVLDEMGRGRPPLAPAARRALLSRALAERWGSTIAADTGEWRGPTAAAPPASVREAVLPVARRRNRAVVRLDPVLHREASSGERWWTSEPTVVEVQTFEGA